MNEFIHPYQKIHGIYFPIVHFYAAKDLQSAPLALSGLIDSGANISLFSKETAHQLGINLTKGKRTQLSGIGSQLIGYEHKIYFNVNGIKFSCRVIFSGALITAFNLIGRTDFFDQFLIQFNEPQKQLILKPQQ